MVDVQKPEFIDVSKDPKNRSDQLEIPLPKGAPSPK